MDDVGVKFVFSNSNVILMYVEEIIIHTSTI